MQLDDIRKRFLSFFESHGHQKVVSSSLVPKNDPTLLFTNAGMVQFKDFFLGLQTPDYKRAASCQICIRAGGKHNDLENVGKTARHHTFFEMLGNFSFGDYFKDKAIEYAWDFLTKELKLPKKNLYVSVYEKDEEAYKIWHKKIKLESSRIYRFGEKDNFWAMGDTGPCGPCSEIYYDHGATIPGGPPGSSQADADRYVEIWNLVFMQYNRDAQGKLTPLPKPSVDTGAGLERLCAVMQGVHNNYDTDLFTSLIEAIAKLGNIKDKTQSSVRVIADHIRACTFLIVDGVVPSNEGRGYVLRRIIRRALRHGNKLGLKELFFYKLVAPLVNQMKKAYPEIIKGQANVEYFLKQEEIQFAKTLEQGLKILEDEIQKLKNETIPGEIIFRLYDTYGFPVDLTADIARERHLHVDMSGFEKAMEKQRQNSALASKFTDVSGMNFDINCETDFVGYEFVETQSVVLALFDAAHSPSNSLKEKGWVVLDKTPFYVESGGQVSDTGMLLYGGGRFIVEESCKVKNAILHFGHVQGEALKLGVDVQAFVEDKRRRDIASHHSATHLLHAALRKTVGNHTQQKGSLVEAMRLRFDYAHHEALSSEQIYKIENTVNEWIRLNVLVETALMSKAQAIAQGADAFFGEKYAEKVRVLRMGDFSLELCGGTHVSRTGDIGFFKIISESSISAGVRRIEAVAGTAALIWAQTQETLMQKIENLVKGKQNVVFEKIQQFQEKIRELEKELENIKLKSLMQKTQQLLSEAQVVEGHTVLFSKIENVEPQVLRQLVENLKSQTPSGIISLASIWEGKVNIVVAVSGKALACCDAKTMVTRFAAELGGRGGGRPELAQVGGDPSRLTQAFDDMHVWIIKKLQEV